MIPAWLAFLDGILAIALVLAGALGAHFYLAAPFFGFQLFVFGWVLSVIGLLSGLLALYLTRKPESANLRPRARFGTIMCAVIALPVLAMVLAGLKHPPINDITTDFDNPPEFVHAQEAVPNHGRDMKYDKAHYMEAQQRGYPALAPLSIAGDPAAVFDSVQKAAAAMPNWKITYTDPKTMTIEGVDTSSLFRFNDDFVIQVRPGEGGASLVEMRSKSRDGIGDFGVNYNRIVGFFGKLKSTSTTG